MKHKLTKFEFDVASIVLIEMPVRTNVLSVEVAIGRPRIVALVEDDVKKMVTKKFRIYSMGDQVEAGDYVVYIGSFERVVGDTTRVYYMFEQQVS